MKKITSFIIVTICLSIVLSACNNNKENNTTEENELKFLDVSIIKPNEKLVADKEYTISAEVTYGDEKVEDANEVKFEIWEKGFEDESEFVIGEHQGEGIYSIQKKFDHDGIFYVVAHVTARDMHNMPKEELLVGDVEAENENKQTEDEQTEHENSHSHHESGANHGSVSISLSGHENAIVNEKVDFLVGLELEGDALTEADVRLEIWKDGDHHHTWVDVDEETPGTYKATYTFTEADTFQVQIHVEKGDIHDHSIESVTVSE